MKNSVSKFGKHLIYLFFFYNLKMKKNINIYFNLIFFFFAFFKSFFKINKRNFIKNIKKIFKFILKS
jgi:hypothetical protein